MLEIGNLKLRSNLILAPLAGVSDLPFRMLNRRFGCELAFTEMLNVRSLSYKSPRTEKMLYFLPGDRPLGVQILGNEPKFILLAIGVLKNYKFDILDFNAACPAKKVVRRGEGAGLLKDQQKLKILLRLIVKNISLPVTLKIRVGWDRDSINAKEVALLAQDAGVSAIFLHGRTRVQGHRGEIDYQMIKNVKKALNIPLVASGDIFSGQLARKMFDETGCDGLVIARGSLGNPWIFREINTFLQRGITLKRPDRDKIIQVMLEHLDACVNFYGERIGVMVFRKFFGWYTKGLRGIRPLREKSSRTKTKGQMTEIICLIKTPENN